MVKTQNNLNSSNTFFKQSKHKIFNQNAKMLKRLKRKTFKTVKTKKNSKQSKHKKIKLIKTQSRLG